MTTLIRIFLLLFAVTAAAGAHADNISACEHTFMLEPGKLSLRGEEKHQYKALLQIISEHYPDRELSTRIIAAFPTCWEKFSTLHPQYKLINVEYNPPHRG